VNDTTVIDGTTPRETEIPSRNAGRRGHLRQRLKLWPPPLHPILFAAYPVLFLYAQNLNDVTTREVVNPLQQALAWGIVATLCFGLVFLLDFRRGALVASFAIIFWYTYGHVANLLLGQHPSTNELLFGWLVVGIVVVVAAVFASSRVIGGITSLANVIAIVLVVITGIQLIPSLATKPAAASGPHAGGVLVPGDRDVYWFIFDRYGSQTSLDYFAGTNNPLQDFLRSRGFYVADLAHANYSRTTTSITGTIGMNYFTDIAAQQGPDSTNLQPLYAVIQHSPVAEFLESRGYKFINNGSWFGPTQVIGDADENTYTTDPNADTDFSVILDQTTFSPVLANLLPHSTPIIPQTDQIHINSAELQERVLARIPDEPSPKFVFSHILLPHPPYVFNPDGSYPTQQEQKTRTEAQAMNDQLVYTNAFIHTEVDRLLSVSDDQKPIIIIQADEGPYTYRYNQDKEGFDWTHATPEELETKFGIMNAMYFPETPATGSPQLYQSISSVNTFRLLFDDFYGQHLPLLPDITYAASGFSHVYDQIDITDLLPSLKSGWIPPTTAPAPYEMTSAGDGEEPAPLPGQPQPTEVPQNGGED
jgi:hypothetical protein